MATKDKKLPSQLRVLRTVRGITLEKLGAAINRAPSWCSRAERGLSGAVISPVDALRIAGVLQVDPKRIFAEVDE